MYIENIFGQTSIEFSLQIERVKKIFNGLFWARWIALSLSFLSMTETKMWTQDGRDASPTNLPKTPSVFERAGSLMNEETISETDSAHWSPFRLREREGCWDVKGSRLFLPQETVVAIMP